MRRTLTAVVGVVVGLYLAGCGATPPAGGTGGTGGSGGSGGSGGGGPLPGDIDLSIPGRFQIRQYTSGWPDSPAFGAATIYYAPDAPPPWAGVAVVPGFTETQLAGWGQLLAAHGFVTITIDTNDPLVSPEQRADALDAAVATLKGENNRGGSPLQGKMADSYGVMGHSMGGGGTIQAAARTVYKAAVSLMPWTAIKTFPQARTPIYEVTATNDALVNKDDAWSIYQSIGSQYKLITEYQGETHSFANMPLYSGHPQLVGKYAIAWFEMFLHNDSRYEAVITNNSAFSRYDAHLP